MQIRIIHLSVWMLLGCMHTMQGEIKDLLINFDNNMRELQKKVVVSATSGTGESKGATDADKQLEELRIKTAAIESLHKHVLATAKASILQAWILVLTGVMEKDNDSSDWLNTLKRLLGDEKYNEIINAIKSSEQQKIISFFVFSLLCNNANTLKKTYDEIADDKDPLVSMLADLRDGIFSIRKADRRTPEAQGVLDLMRRSSTYKKCAETFDELIRIWEKQRG